MKMRIHISGALHKLVHLTWERVPFLCLENSQSAFKTEPECHLLSESFCSKEEWAGPFSAPMPAYSAAASLQLYTYLLLKLYFPAGCELLISKSVSYSSLNPHWLEHRKCSTEVS